MRPLLLTLVACLYLLTSWGQDESEKTRKLGSQIFLPSLEIGFLSHMADDLGANILIKTSVEYRFHNNNDFFLRLNYDTQSVDYEVEQDGFTNVLKGKVQLTDILFGPGYRFGDNEFRIFLMGQGGMRLYDYPVATIENLTLRVENESNRVFTSRVMLGAEYYFDRKSAVTLTLIYGQVWEKVDFWTDNTSALGFSVGFITALL